MKQSRSMWSLALAVLLSLMGACAEGKAGASKASAQGRFEKTALRYQGFAGKVTYPELAEEVHRG